MSSVKVRSNTLKDGRQSLYLDIYHNGKTKHKTLSLFLQSSTLPEAKKINKEKLLVAENVRLKIEEQLFKGTFGEEDQSQITFIDWVKQLTKKRENSGINYQAWKSSLKHMENFFKDKEPLLIKDLSIAVLEDIKTYLLSKLSQNSVASYFDIIKHSIHEAFRRKLIKEDIACLTKSVRYIDPHREFLTEEEIIALYKTECEIPVIKKAFLFSCFTGLRFSDTQQLTWTEVQYSESIGWYLRFRQKKTKGSETLPLSETALKIIGEPNSDKSQKVFENLKYSAWYNIKLTNWFTAAGIRKKAHFHLSRHTNACLLLQKGVDIYTVSKILGHSDLKSTMVYAKIVDSKKRDAVNLLPNIEFRNNK